MVILITLGCTAGPAATGAAPTPARTTSAPTADPAGGALAGAVDVALQEWAVNPTPQAVAAGDVTFSVTNNGPDDPHEFVIFRTDLAPGDLPTDDTGAVDENAAGLTLIDEVEEIAVGTTETLSTNLDAGAYVLICNIYDEAEQEAHYQMGMRIAFTVD
jgi:uncharacterized cupredoxin-like copper-binding protein